MGAWMRGLRYGGFAACAALACAVALYELWGNLLVSFGWDASGAQLLGFELPPLVVAEQTLCSSEVFLVLLPLGVALALSAPFKAGYAQLLAARVGVRRVVGRALASGLLLGAAFWAVVTASVLVAALALCHGSMDASSLAALERQGALLAEGGSPAFYAASLAARLLFSLAVGCVTAGLACACRHAAAGFLAVPLMWAACQYVTPVAEAAALATLPGGASLAQLLSWRSDHLQMMLGQAWPALAGLACAAVVLATAAAVGALACPRALVVRGGRP